ncbi:hypothetical protein L6452_18238 [Arctium lappa]|uniref:Uncharacterized protein n=1 Tax=Arctium lappa TaxID=4217 RepID=A0ACB9C5N4_ARCLA|nr:hypothetical protein L6452_18238 [Arctium lappa]
MGRVDLWIRKPWKRINAFGFRLSCLKEGRGFMFWCCLLFLWFDVASCFKKLTGPRCTASQGISGCKSQLENSSHQKCV